MKKIYSFLGALLSLFAVVTASQAADGNVQINGEISTSTCEVDAAATDAAYGVIPWGSIRKSSIPSGGFSGDAPSPLNGASNPKKDFFITFKNCSVGDLGKPYLVTVTGPHTLSSGAFGNSIAGGSNVELLVGARNETGAYQVFDRSIGKSTREYTLDDVNQSIPMRAALYKQYASTITPGDFSFIVDYAVQFN